MKPTKCPAREKKKMRQEKRKKKGGEKAKFGFLRMPELRKLIFCIWIRRPPSVRPVNRFVVSLSGAPARAKRAWDRAPCSWNMVNLFSFGCHVIDRAYVRTYIRTYASTDCTGGVGKTIKRKGGVSQACLGKSTSLI